ncbi:MAG: GntR family transcriptional regulator [Anaerolineae bacterium]|jgi:DNA-binding GntR family transcriptional regulator
MSDTIESLSEHRTLSDAVFHRLRDAVIDGRLAPGQWLRQEALAQEFGLSQMPVREALRRLVAEGLAERIPYRGVRVVKFTPEDIADMFTLRLTLEGLAVRHATPHISQEEIDELKKNLARGAGLTAQHEMPERRELNTAFHLTICRASGHRYLVRQVESLWAWFPSVMLYEGMRRQEELSPARLARENAEHRAILAALEARDAGRAEAETRRHIRNLAEELAEVLGIDDGLNIL